MTHIIMEPCIGVKDTACVVVCPVDCIHPKADETGFAGAEQLYIDPGTCIDCGLCVDECLLEPRPEVRQPHVSLPPTDRR